MRAILPLLLLVGCSTMPEKELYVSWQDCAGKGQVHRVRVIDTTAPVVDCIKAAPPADAAQFVLLTLLGAPPGACAVIWTNPNGSVNHAEIYAALTPPVSVGLIWATGFITPEQAIGHELEHVFGARHVLFPFIDRCES